MAESRPLPLPLRLLLAVASGVLVFTSFPNWNIHQNAWYGLVPLLIACRGCGVKHAFLLGLLAGTVTNVGGFHWMTGMLEEFGHLPWPIAWAILALQAVTQGLTMAIGAGLWRYLVQRGAPPGRAAFLSLWAGEVVVPMIFPWYMANGLSHLPLMQQTADLGGVHLVSAMLYASNAALAELIAWPLDRRRPSWPLVIGAAVAALSAAGYGVWRMDVIDSRQSAAPSMRIGLVEGNIGIFEKQAKHLEGALRVQTLRNNLLIHQRMSAELEAAGAELILWPESAYMPYGAIPILHGSDRHLLIGDGGTFLRHDGERVVPAAAERLGMPRTSGLLTGLSSPRGDWWRYVIDGRRVISITGRASHEIAMPEGETAVTTVAVPSDMFGRVQPGLVVGRSGRVWSLEWPARPGKGKAVAESEPTLVEVPNHGIGEVDITSAARSGAGTLILAGRNGVLIRQAGFSIQRMASPTKKDLWAVAGDPLGRQLLAVGAGGTIVASRGQRWRRVRTGGADLYAVWFDVDGSAWAGGQNGTLLHSTSDGRWRRVPLGANVDVLGGACDSEGVALVIGRGGRVFSNAGGSFREIPGGTQKELTAIVGMQPNASYVIPRSAKRVLPARAPLPKAELKFPENVVADGRVTEFDRSTPMRGFSVPMLFGALTYDGILTPRNADCEACYNSALIIDGKGNVLDLYDKRYLLVFGEYLPFGETWPQLYKLLPEGSRFQPGTRTTPMLFGKARIGMLICYEDLLPRHVIRVAAHDPNVFINLTNDAWFGKSAEPYHHLQLAQLRSIEYRRWLIRSTNTGVSVFIDANGRRVQETSLDGAETMLRDVPLMEGRTIYAMTGDWPPVVLLILLLLTWARALRDSSPTGRASGKRTAKKRKRKKRAKADGETMEPARLG